MLAFRFRARGKSKQSFKKVFCKKSFLNLLLIEKNKMLRLSLSTERKFKLAFEFFAVGAFFLHFIFFVVKSDGVFFVK